MGKSVNEAKRGQSHLRACLEEKNQKVHKHIMSTGGFGNWCMTILERMENPELLQEREQHFIDTLEPSLNMRRAKKKDNTRGFTD